MTGGPSAGSTVVAVVGAGTMGAGIAQVAAAAGHPVTVYDAVEGAAERAIAAIRDRVAQLVTKGRLDCDPAGLRLSVATELGELAPARCVIEAAAEDLGAWTAFGYDPRFAPSLLQRALVEAGWLGRKSGRGWYRYGDDAPPPEGT